ncbi:NAD(P)/FAD-dependent oxidoreductase [Brevundimonas sp.]|uniref:NAD(P)/FAD-dependent oxidoreductase n=1 Tax=Brevundimonas sp. TaxID=1871086 RepID=UPI0025C64824|nr:NAD(P)/FAD-dependent oxidoreductase [Brevundimonas sp.]
MIIIGAGPAGLTAALYLARYRRAVLVLHDGHSRALRLPFCHNAPGFPEGIPGPDLIARMSQHAVGYGAEIRRAKVFGVSRKIDGFTVTTADGAWHARAVIFATGIDLNQVDLPDVMHEQAIHDAVLRYCPVCDGYEAIDRVIGVIGCDSNGAAEALFLRTYSPNVTLMPLSHSELTDEQEAQLAAAGISVEHGPLDHLEPGPDRMRIILQTGKTVEVDVLYPALGCSPRAGIALDLGIAEGDHGTLDATSPFGADVPGAFAAGDVVEGLDQISVAVGQGAVAATRAHNYLRERDRETLQSR